MTLSQTRDFDQQLLTTKRNFDIVVGAGSKSIQECGVFFADRADQQDRYGRSASVPLQPATQIHPVHVGHDHLANDDVRFNGGRDFQCLMSTLHREHFVAFRLEQVPQQIERHLIVIDDQNGRRIFQMSIHQEEAAD